MNFRKKKKNPQAISQESLKALRDAVYQIDLSLARQSPKSPTPPAPPRVWTGAPIPVAKMNTSKTMEELRALARSFNAGASAPILLPGEEAAIRDVLEAARLWVHASESDYADKMRLKLEQAVEDYENIVGSEFAASTAVESLLHIKEDLSARSDHAKLSGSETNQGGTKAV